MRTHAGLWTLLGLLSVPAVDAGAQAPSSASAMVVDVPQDALYHAPTCTLVRAAGSKVKVMRQGEAVRRGMKPHECSMTPEEATDSVNASIVLVQNGDSRYHKEGCSRLTSAATRVPLAEAGKKHWPCAVCKPPIRKSTRGAGQ